MAYQILDVEGKLIETLQEDAQVEALFEGDEFQVFWDDEGLIERLKEGGAELEMVRLVKRVAEE